jgi:hypothetical protein
MKDAEKLVIIYRILKLYGKQIQSGCSVEFYSDQSGSIKYDGVEFKDFDSFDDCLEILFSEFEDFLNEKK